MSDLFVGSTIAGCRLDAVAGRGGMGVVYRATQLALNRTVALKAIAPALAEDEGFRERFQRESHLAASIEHPNVIPVYEAGERDGTLYLIMRWVEGTDLRALLLSEGRLEPVRALRILRPVASALAAAHRRGLVHRDVKPANVLIASGEGEEQEHVYLTDFGIAKRSGGQSLTRTGVLVGTLDYTAPERIEGAKGSPASDIYAFGCMLFETLSGRVPYPRPTDIAKMHAHLNEPVASLADLRPDVPEVLAGIAAKAMAKRPEDRYGSAADLAAALDDALGELEPTAPHATTTATVASGRRRPLWPAIAGAALLVAGVVIAIIASAGGGGAGTHRASVPTSTPTHSATIPTANTGVPSLHGSGLTNVNPIKLADTPTGLAADGRRAWVTAPGRLIEIGAGGTHPRLSFSGAPTNVAVDARRRVWLTGVGASGVTIFDPATGGHSDVQAGEAPNLIAMSAGVAWLARAGAASVTRVPLDGGSPQAIAVQGPIAAIGTANRRLWVAPVSGSVTVLNDDGSRSDVAGPPIPGETLGIASSNGVWFMSRSLTRVDPRKQLATGGAYAVHGDQAPVGPDPAAIGALPGNNSIWVLTRGDRMLRRIATNGADDKQIIAHVAFPGTPGHLAVGDHILWVDDPATKLIYPITF